MIESKLEETLWKKNCEFLFNLFIELQSTMIDQYREKLGMLHDLAFLEYFDKFWSSMRLYTHWNLTLLNPVEGYAKLFKSKTLLQATLEQLRVVVLSFNDKLSTSLLRQLHDLRNGNDVNSLMLARLFKAFFEVDYEGKSKIVKIGDKFLYNYDEKMGLKPHEYDKKAPEKQKTTTFCQCIKEKLLAESKAFYSKKVQEWIGLTVPDFLDTANTYLQKEAELIDLYLDLTQVLLIRES